ncbi:MAG: sigma-54-dependent Fis family transcriptional regulator [Acidobacteria bacterium]|nr:sigma-54-dependent Fis family transcriptional regulator [Acidobacteriota bacterium]
MKQTILIVDDEPAQRQLLAGALSRDYTVIPAADGKEAVQLLAARSVDLVITDQRMPRMDGMELLKWIQERTPEIPVIVLTAHGSVETAVEAMKLGAREYLTKPLESPEEIRLVSAKALHASRLQARSIVHQADQDSLFPADIVAESEAMKRVLTLAAQVAPQPSTVLLTGESGTGKEIVARFIHRRSPRSEEPLVAVNCAALSETLLESELFGHEKGAFTGAVQTRIGRFELAHGGTLFLDEVAETSLSIQPKLLRALQEQQFERLGGTRTIPVDVRVIAATNRDLSRALEDKSLREDLYYRLNVFPIHIPPLRERPEDIVPLAEHFSGALSARMGRSLRPLSEAARSVLRRHGWPGNVRELQNAVERALIVSAGETIEPEHLPLPGAGWKTDRAQPRSLAEIEKAAILEALERNRGERKAAAEQLGVSLRTLQYRLKEYGLTTRD